MGLKIWLPLTNETLIQQGTSTTAASIVGTVSLTEKGKLGKCATFTSTGGRIALPGAVMNSFASASMAFWLKINGWGSYWDFFVQCGQDGTNWTDYIFNFTRNNANSQGIFTISDGTNASNQSFYTSTLNTDTWYHIVCTYETGKCRIYLNGVLDKEYNTSITPAFNKITQISLGRSSRNTYQAQCSINDFRIYDYCLREKEIAELAKGLVIHYPLNRQSWGQENLFTENYWSYGSGWNVKNLINSNVSTTKPIINLDGSCTLTGGGDTTNSQCYCANNGNMVSLESNTTYTISVKITTNGPCNFRMWWYDYDNNDTRLNTYSTNSEIIPSGTTKIFSVTHTTVANTAKCYWELNLYSTPSTSTCLMHAKSLKLEKGSIVTPWCPNSIDTIYTTMNLNSNIEYDGSGFQNNGTRYGTFTWSSDTPNLYNVSTYFNDYTSYIKAPMGGWTPTEITLNCWVKSSNKSPRGNWHIPLNLDGQKAEISIHNDGKITTGFVIAGTRRTGNFGSVDILNGQWHMLTVTFDGTNIKSYIDANLIETRNYAGALSSMNYVYCGIFGGDSSYANTQLYQSDVRVYATALSAKDITSLYQNSAYIDDNNVIYGKIR